MKTYETPKEDMMKSDLLHYEKASNAIHEWHSSIPRAIKEYYDESKGRKVKLYFLAIGFILGFILSYEIFK